MSANSTYRTNNKTFHAKKTRAGLHVLGASTLVLCLLGGWMWREARSSGACGAWAEVAQGHHYLRLGRPDLALLSVYHVRDEVPGSGEAAAVKGHVWIRLGEYSDARRALECALTLQPNQFEEAVTLAELNLELGNVLRAIEVFEMAARLRPREFRVWFAMGSALKELGDDLRASHAYEKALELDPDHGEALVELIDTLLRGGQTDRAEPWMARALARHPDDPVVLGFAAVCASYTNRFDDAVALADRTLGRDPRNLHALLARVRCLALRSQWKEALPEAERTVSVAPHDMGALNLLAIIESRAGFAHRASLTLAKLNVARIQLESLSALNEDIARNPEDPRLPWKKGRLALESGMVPLASRCFQAASALNPQFEPARESLAALQASRPDQKAVPRRLSSILDRSATSPRSTAISPQMP